jgi:hypothetical protein
MGWQIKFTNILSTHAKTQHILDSMNHFDSDMSNSTNTVVYFDRKMVLYIYIADNIAHNLCRPIRVDDNSSACTFTTGKSVILMEHPQQ